MCKIFYSFKSGHFFWLMIVFSRVFKNISNCHLSSTQHQLRVDRYRMFPLSVFPSSVFLCAAAFAPITTRSWYIKLGRVHCQGTGNASGRRRLRAPTSCSRKHPIYLSSRPALISYLPAFSAFPPAFTKADKMVFT